MVRGRSSTAVAAGVRELRILIARKVGTCIWHCAGIEYVTVKRVLYYCNHAASQFTLIM